MFARQAFGNPFQLSAVGYPFPHLAAGVNPLISGINPLAALAGFGVNPYVIGSIAGLGSTSPFLTPQFGAGITSAFNPIAAAQLATIAPGAFSPFLTPSFAGNVGALGSTFGGWGGITPFGPTLAGTVNPFVLTPNTVNPASIYDPVAGALLAQQLNPFLQQQLNPFLQQQQLPIRSLISPQQFDPFHATYPGMAGPIAGQALDPYSALVQAQSLSPLAVSPIHQMLRAQVAPWVTGLGVPNLAAQGFPYASVGTGLGI